MNAQAASSYSQPSDRKKKSAAIVDMETFQRSTDSTGMQQFVKSCIELEFAVLGCMIIAGDECIPQWFQHTCDVPDPVETLFWRQDSELIAKSILSVHAAGEPVDFVTVIAEAHKRGWLDQCGGPGKIASTEQWFYSANNFGWYLGRLLDRHKDAQRIRLGERLQTLPDGDPNELIQSVMREAQKLLKAKATMETFGSAEMGEVSSSLMKSDPDNKHSIPSYFSQLNRLFGGYKRGEMALVGAPPGRGKTAFILEEAFAACTIHGLVVDAFLMESNWQQIWKRWCGQRFGIPASCWDDETMRDAYYSSQIVKAGKEIERLKGRFYMAPRRAYNASDIAAAIRERKTTTGKPCDMILVDHINTMREARAGHHSASSFESMSENIVQLWDIAAQENAALIVTSQLSLQEIRNSMSKKQLPTMGAFKYGVPQEKAKVAIILDHNDEQFTKQDCVESKLVVVKANDGSQGFVDSLFLKPFTLFVEDTEENRSHFTELLGLCDYERYTVRADVKGYSRSRKAAKDEMPA